MITTVMAVLAGIAAFAVAIKSLPTIWEGTKTFYKFLLGMEKATIIPELLLNQQTIMTNNEDFGIKLDSTLTAIAAISDELKCHMMEEEEILSHERDIVKRLAERVDDLSITISHNSSKIASVVFRQAVFADTMAYYTVELEDDGWRWSWGNRSYFDLTGMTPEMALSGHHWDIVKSDQRSWVKDYVSDIESDGEPLDMDFILVNMKTQEESEVKALAWPLHDGSGKATVYLGAIEKKMDHVRFEKP